MTFYSKTLSHTSSHRSHIGRTTVDEDSAKTRASATKQPHLLRDKLGKHLVRSKKKTQICTDSPEVCAAVAEDDFVYLKLHILDFDHGVGEVSLQAELVAHAQLRHSFGI